MMDELAVLDRGRVVASGTPAQLRAAEGGELRLELSLPPEGEDPSELLGELPVRFARRARTGHRVLLTLAASDAARAVAWATALRTADRIEGYALSPITLEDAYLAATAEGGAAPSREEPAHA
ncbi:hypothetical protein [Nocardiopsis xinjiangensis]|uniref:hypothetical protein n=1 Tax=Nocardiopsis xinjiangensis TaxID=124285 RepID=UPI0003482C45|nr:hypothetical protein [Nocardiopsis xinjiangensis]